MDKLTRRSAISGMAGAAVLSQSVAAQQATVVASPFNSARYKSLIDKVDTKWSLDFLAKIVRHKSYTDTQDENDLAHVIANSMTVDIPGIKAVAQAYPGREVDKMKTRYNAVGVLSGSGGGKSILYNGHIDTNPVTEGWTVDPFGGLIDKGFIYGIGVSNMKAGTISYYCALRELVRAGIKLKGDVTLTCVSAELSSGGGTAAVIKGGYRGDYFVNCEPTDLVALTMHAIGSPLDIELIGNTRHMSKREEAIDAIAVACDLIPRLNALKFSDAKTLDQLAINRVQVGVVHGALGKDFQEWRSSQVADYVRIKGSARYAPGQTHVNAMADIQKQLDAIMAQYPGLKANNLGAAMARPRENAGYFVSKDAPIVKALNDAYFTTRGVPQPTGIEITPARYYGTDAPPLQAAGMQGIVCGPGGKYNTMPDERVEIVDYIDMIKVHMLTMINICGVE